MVAVPAVPPVTTPVALTVATEAFVVDQVPPETVEVNVDELPAQIDWLPVIVPADACVETVNNRVAVALTQPPVPATV